MNKRTIRDVIAGRELLTTQGTTTVRRVARRMRERGSSAILVLDGVNLAGIFTERDALYRVVAAGLEADATEVAAVMTREPATVHPDSLFASALEIMHIGRFRHVPVVDQGRPVGLVSSSDAMGAELEQFMYAVIVEEQSRDILA